MSEITDGMVDAAFDVFKGDMLMREEDRDLIERMLRAALTALEPAPAPARLADAARNVVLLQHDDERLGVAIERLDAALEAVAPARRLVAGDGWMRRQDGDKHYISLYGEDGKTALTVEVSKPNWSDESISSAADAILAALRKGGER